MMRGWGWPPLFLAVAIALGVEALLAVAEPTDRALIRDLAFRQGRTDVALIEAVQWITWTGDAAQRTVVMIAFAAWLFLRKRPRAALVMLVVVPLAGVTSSLLKEVFARPRPSVVPHLDLVTSFSYPSGHAVNAMAVLLLGALLLATRTRALWVVVAVVAAMVIGASRIILGVHYPTDVIGGWLIGVAFALIGWRIAQRVEAPPPVNPTPEPASPPE